VKFKEFKENVEEWARVRKIYEQSTEAHQQAKALEEIGEYLTATTDEERMDAIGDIAVCIVNAAKLRGSGSGVEVIFNDDLDGIGDVAYCVIDGAYDLALGELSSISFSSHQIPFELCIEKAWNEIKDRKGMMIDKKYVKWESMTEEQQKEYMEN
jgi:hypothetical protein